MKAAFIPPISALDRFGNGGFHLLLSHLMETKHYREHYKRERKNGAYLVLDNSAHEHKVGTDPDTLMLQAAMLNAQEVVVPDALDNADDTIERALQAHEAWHEGPYGAAHDLAPALMYVPQGATYEDWQFCLANLVRIHLFSAKRYHLRRDFVIGISKDYEVWDGGLMRLLDEDVLPLRLDLFQQGIKMNVHMLGWGRDLWALEDIAAKHKWIRSTDSAKPFVYALDYWNLGSYLEREPPPYPKRPENYFRKRFNEEQEKLATFNAMVFRAMASGSVTNTVVV